MSTEVVRTSQTKFALIATALQLKQQTPWLTISLLTRINQAPEDCFRDSYTTLLTVLPWSLEFGTIYLTFCDSTFCFFNLTATFVRFQFQICGMHCLVQDIGQAEGRTDPLWRQHCEPITSHKANPENVLLCCLPTNQKKKKNKLVPILFISAFFLPTNSGSVNSKERYF